MSNTEEKLNKGLMGILKQHPVTSESQNIKLEDLTTFVDRDGNENPSSVDEKDPEFLSLVASIKANGLNNPIIVRKDPSSPDKYQILCGHHRVAAFRKIGLEKIKAYVKDLSDDDAAFLVATDNFSRKKNYKPTEKGRFFKMALEAMNRQGDRRDLTCGQNGHKLEEDDEKGKKSRDKLSELVGESPKNISRYVRLTYLIPELQAVVDSKRLKFVPAVELSYLEEKNQQLVFDTVFNNDDNTSLNIEQATKIRNKADQGYPLSEAIISAIANFGGEKHKIKLTKGIKALLPEDIKGNDKLLEDYIIKAITAYEKNKTPEPEEEPEPEVKEE